MKLLFLFSSADNVGDVFDNGMSFQNKVMVQLEMIIKTSDTPFILSLMSFDYIVREMEGTFCDSSPVISELFYFSVCLSYNSRVVSISLVCS